jgi:hypothetical protein
VAASDGSVFVDLLSSLSWPCAAFGDHAFPLGDGDGDGDGADADVDDAGLDEDACFACC